MSFRVAVDVGGTFTDLIALDLDTGGLRSAKVPSVPGLPGSAVEQALADARIPVSAIETFFHGTTYGLNIVLEHKGADVGLITTAGFRDVLEIGRATWPMYSLHWRPPAPLVPRQRRLEVRERMSAQGGILTPLAEDDALSALAALRDDGLGAVAVCLLNAYANTAHEERIAELCADRFPELACTVSHLVTREYREYERTVTTVVEATIASRLHEYFADLERFLAANAFRGDLMVTRADGGVMGVAEAIRRPVRTLTSGPASGVMGAAHLAAAKGHPNVISIDMGGTSFDAALITDGRPRLAAATVLEHMPLLLPNVEIGTIGAGGGSLARVEPGGALAVGPESAGAVPGPVSYLRGGTVPTFTDGALVSGLIGSSRFLDGAMSLDENAAAAAIEEQIGRPLGLATEEAAAGIVRIVEANMAALLESITIENGVDPRDYVLYAYGGGGPLVAASLAHELGIGTVVVPPYPGVFSAWGMLTLEIVHDFVDALFLPLDELTADGLGAKVAALDGAGRDVLTRERVAEAHQRFAHAIDMRYFGQEHTLSVPLRSPQEGGSLAGELRDAFTELHRRTYGYALDESVELVSLRLRAEGSRDRPVGPGTPTPHRPAPRAARPVGERGVWHRESVGSRACPVWLRDQLPEGHSLAGPAIVEESTATTFVPPGWRLEVDGGLSLVLTAYNGRGGS